MKPVLRASRAVFDAALALVYPQQCAVCGDSVEARGDGVACANCWRATRMFTAADVVCWKCGALNRASIEDERRHSVRCGTCDEDAFTLARACGLYEGALRASVLQLKREPHVATRVARNLFRTMQREPMNCATIIVAVPLSPQREAERGFNQATVLAHALARLSGLPVDEYSLCRRIHTARHRAGMDARARRESIAEAFAVSRVDAFASENVLLIDDVFTTGATVSECSTVLRAAGATDVFVLTVARSQAVL